VFAPAWLRVTKNALGEFVSCDWTSVTRKAKPPLRIGKNMSGRRRYFRLVLPRTGWLC
jgi:hypothetical protein